MTQENSLDVSVIIPLYNEEDNIPDLYERLQKVLPQLGKTYEVIIVDDGSQDTSFAKLSAIAAQDSHIKIIRFTRNFGQTAAMAAGFKAATGKVYITMDADNQNDPNDIPKLLDKIAEGYGVVSGWRQKRQDTFLTRKLPSWIANWLISKMTGVRLKDYGCTLKAYDARYVDSFNLYGEMHRFIPAYAGQAGAKIIEVPVNHFARTKGSSKYGLSRIYKVLLDLITVMFLSSYATTPLYLFGGIGFALNGLAFLSGGVVLYQKFAFDIFAHRNPLLLLAVFLSVLGVLSIMVGLLAELLMRTYHESQDKSIYLVEEKVNL